MVNSTPFFFSPGADSPGIGGAEDIVHFDGNGNFNIVFNGSTLGLSSKNIDGIDFIAQNKILISFANSSTSLPGLGAIDDSDVVLFEATSLGSGTAAGTFSMFLDGSSIGLTTNNEDIDGLTLMEDGSLLFSTTGQARLGGVTLNDEDIGRWDPLTGTVTRYFDGSDVSLTNSSEDVNAVSQSNGDLLLSTTGNLSVPGLFARDDDVSVFNPTSLGPTTRGSFDRELFFDGSRVGFFR
ncbi:MAG: hypothetical protein AB4040_16340, partial [Synechococcus sp.]